MCIVIVPLVRHISLNSPCTIIIFKLRLGNIWLLGLFKIGNFDIFLLQLHLELGLEIIWLLELLKLGNFYVFLLQLHLELGLEIIWLLKLLKLGNFDILLLYFHLEFQNIRLTMKFTWAL